MMRSTIFLISLLGLCNLAISDNIFNRPPSGGIKGDFRDNPTYKEGERVDFLWDTDLAYVNIVIWQKFPLPSSLTSGDDGVTYFKEPMLRNSTRMSYEWTAVLGGAVPPNSQNSVFWLAMYDASSNSTTVITESHYFNVSRTAVETMSVSSSSMTASSTSATTTSELSNATTEFHASNAGLSSAAVAGVAVGATVAGIVIIAIGAFFVWRHLQAKKLAAAPGNSLPKPGPVPELGESEIGNSNGHSELPPNYFQHQNAPQLRELQVPSPTMHEAP